VSVLQLFGWLIVLAALIFASERLRQIRIQANTKPPPISSSYLAVDASLAPDGGDAESAPGPWTA
jgi:hypothetical protein